MARLLGPCGLYHFSPFCTVRIILHYHYRFALLLPSCTVLTILYFPYLWNCPSLGLAISRNRPYISLTCEQPSERLDEAIRIRLL